MGRRRVRRGIAVAAVLAAGSLAASDGAAAGAEGGPAAYWTPQRRAAAQPRDLVLDHRGLAYERRADGTLVPHGHDTPAEPAPLRQVPTARPTGGGGGGSTSGDTTAPVVSGLDPAAGATIGANHVFRATVTDAGSGVRSVSFKVGRAGGRPQTFNAARTTGTDEWTVSLQGFTDGSWTWHVVAKDGAKNTTTSPSTPFTVSTTPSGGGTGGVVADAPWPSGGDVQEAAGRIYFEMPSNGTQWAGYVCSGTAVTDGATGRSVILTAAHCVYDDVAKAFARNVLFIPNQDATTGAGTDRDCSNDPVGCWAPSFGVVDADWASRTFPDNIPWDYAYYVVGDTGHAGAGDDVALDVAVDELDQQFSAPAVGAYTHALGYSYSDDPNFMYCAEPVASLDAANWWLDHCDLSGGSSGGPWVQPMDTTTGRGPIISVNSWGYTTRAGMAGPKLSGSSASCVFGAATSTAFSSTVLAARGLTAPGC